MSGGGGGPHSPRPHSPLLDFDQLWATNPAAVSGAPGQFDIHDAAVPAVPGPHPEAAAGWIVPYNPEVAGGHAAGHSGSAPSAAGATIDPYSGGPEIKLEQADIKLEQLELGWKGPTGAAEFETWELEARRAAALKPPTSIKGITDEQLAYTELDVLMQLMRKARYTPAEIAATKKLRRKCKNRLSAKGSASKRRVAMSSIAAVNKRLVQCVSGLSSKNDQLEASNARLQAEVAAARDEASRADAEKARFQAEVDRLTQLVSQLANGGGAAA